MKDEHVNDVTRAVNSLTNMALYPGCAAGYDGGPVIHILKNVDVRNNQCPSAGRCLSVSWPVSRVPQDTGEAGSFPSLGGSLTWPLAADLTVRRKHTSIVL